MDLDQRAKEEQTVAEKIINEGMITAYLSHPIRGLKTHSQSANRVQIMEKECTISL